VSIAVHGDLEGRAPVLRSGARPGDVVAHAGVRGRSAAGLALLTAGRGEAFREHVTAYLRPTSPLAAGPAAARAGATAMLDLSDGLLRDAGRLARASGVVLDLEPVALAFADDVVALTAAATMLGQDAADWVLTGGEDHGLLATFAAGTPLPPPFRAVGRVRATSDGGPAGVLVDGAPATGSPGWDHFAR
jgi:thiamine-monophosphate kinase